MHLLHESTPFAEEDICTNIPQLLQANIKQVVEVQLDGREWFTGRINTVQMPDPIQTSGKEAGPVSGILVMVTEKGSSIIPLKNITSVKMPIHPPPEFRAEEEKDQILQTMLKKPAPITQLRINYKNQADSQAKLSYVSQGISWQAVYHLAFSSKSKTCQMSMGAVVFNTVEDLQADELVCASDALSLPPSLETQPSSSSELIKDESPFYKFKSVSVNQHESVTLPVFTTQTVPFEEVYHAEIKHFAEVVNVHRSIKLQNTTQTSWAMGTINVIKDGNLVAHSDLSNTPIGGTTLVNLARSTQVKISKREEKQASEGSHNNTRHPTNEIVATYKIINAKPEPVVVVLRKHFIGVSKDTGPQTATLTSTASSEFENNQNTITWEITLASGEMKNISHTYTVVEQSKSSQPV